MSGLTGGKRAEPGVRMLLKMLRSKGGPQPRLVVAAVSLAATLLALFPAGALADCDGVIPPFGEFAPTASRIVIGEVTSTDPNAPWKGGHGASSRFTLRIDYVVRGSAASVLTVRDQPFLPCADHIIQARPGDRIALAFDIALNLEGFGAAPDAKFATIAWVAANAPREWWEVEQLTVAEVYELAGEPPPTDTLSDDPARSAGTEPLIAAVVSALVTVLVLRRLYVRIG